MNTLFFQEQGINLYIALYGRGLWYLIQLSTKLQLYYGGQFYLWVKPEDPEKNTDLS
jgi:hypothetical protein